MYIKILLKIFLDVIRAASGPGSKVATGPESKPGSDMGTRTHVAACQIEM